ncbi:MAG: adenylate/guanylate cyclase domain-containing protein [Actinomycetota bacterium]
MTACSTCGAANPADAMFCSKCGSALPDSSPADEVRKTVTILFCDVTGSTQLGEQLDPESLRKVMARYFDAMRAEIELHGGTVEKFIGDAVMAVFGIPSLHEDDALRAVRAADGMREGLETLNKDLERDFGVRLAARIGVNTGEVLVGSGSTDFGRVTGDAVNTAARLETAAQPGEVLIGADTYRLVRDAVDAESVEPRTVKGKAEPVECYRLVGVLAGIAAPPRAFTSPIVGRERELEDLQRAFDRSVQDRACLLFTVLGTAGAGKSRLVEEFLGHVGESAQALVGRCLPYGEGITYWPVAQALRAALEVHDFDEPEEVRSRLDGILARDDHAGAIAARLSEVLGIADGHSAPEETAWAIRRFLEILASERPVIAVWEDVHWGEPALLDAIDHVADWAGDAPIMLLCTARPEFLDSRPAWGAGKQRASALTLPPLPADASTQLIANLLGGGRLPADAAGRVADAGGGNPLFVEQMVSMLIDDGLLVREDGGWTPAGDLASIAVPPSVAALLAARLERLSDEERRVIGAASVIGKVFHVGAVRELVPEGDRADAGSLVRSLVRKELVRETRSTIPGEDAFEFRHILIRDAAYAAIPKERRAEQHRRFADWCVRTAGERIEELEEIVGYHLEQAVRNRESLGALDEDARALAIDASARLESAGMRAYDRPDMSAAANLLRRAETLLPPDDPGRVAILTTLATALFETGRVDETRDTVGEAEARAADSGDPVAVERARVARWQLVDRGVERPEELRAQASRAIAVFEAAGDQRGLVRAWNFVASIDWFRGQGDALLDAVGRALESARGGTARYEEHEALGRLTAALVRGPIPVPEGIARAERTIEAYSGSREVDALMCHALAHLRARIGEFDAARAAMDRYRSFFRDTGQTVSYFRSAEVAFDVAMLAGEAEDACDIVEEAARSLAELGDSWPYLAAFLAQGRYAVGRYVDAREPAEFGAERGDEVEGSLALGVLAKLAARSRDATALETIAEAVARVDRTDFLFDRGTLHTDRGETLRLLGREDEALSAFDEAIELFDQKGDRVSSERVRRLRAEAT